MSPDRTYRVELNANAKRMLREIRDFLSDAVGDDAHATKVVSSLLDSAKSLARFPLRRTVIAGDPVTGVELRGLKSGSYQIVYTVKGDRVLVVAVLHDKSDIQARLASALKNY